MPGAATLCGHLACYCIIEAAYVSRGYWVNAKNFHPSLPELPRLLSFLGSGAFVKMEACTEEGRRAEDDE